MNDQAIALRRILQAGHEAVNSGAKIQEVDWALGHDAKPRWSSTLDVFDHRTGGGFYGVSVVAGQPGAGKSLVALASATAAAASGWDVVHADFELDPGLIAFRMMRQLGSSPRRLKADVPERLRSYSLRMNWQLADFFAHAWLEREIQAGTRILFVVDSFNKMVRTEKSRSNDYFRDMDRYTEIAVDMTRMSGGRISWLFVSELNKDGGLKGMQLEYEAHAVLKIKKTGPRLVEIEATKSREGGEGKLGEFELDDSFHFVTPGREPPPAEAPSELPF